MRYRYNLALIVALLLGACGGRAENTPTLSSDGDFSARAAPSILEQRVQPSDTGQGIDRETLPSFYHHVAFPERPEQRKNLLVLHLVGSAVAPQSAIEIARFAADLGYGVLNLRYANKAVVDVVCGDRINCPEQFRGETVFGESVAYALSRPAYDEPANIVNRQNSIVNRVVNLLDFLSNQPASSQNPQPGYWRQFLLHDDNSPYVTPHAGNVYPDWSKIVVSGHSQGGGMAAMLAMNLPRATPVRRVILFAAPNDTTGDSRGNEPSPWLLKPSATALENYWGLRHANDDNLGQWVKQNWQRLGGPFSAGVGGPGNTKEADIGDGAIHPRGAQRLVLTASSASSADAHSSTVDSSFYANTTQAWRYLFTANGQD